MKGQEAEGGRKHPHLPETEAETVLALPVVTETEAETLLPVSLPPMSPAAVAWL